MAAVLDPLIIVVLVLNLYVLATSRLYSVIGAVGVQGALLGFLPLLVHHHVGWTAVIVAAAAVGIKGVLVPGMLRRAMREARIRREVEPLIGFMPSILLGAAATGASLIAATALPAVGEFGRSLLIPGSMATVLSGFIVIVTRFKAISQVIGYLMLENGIFIFGMLIVEAMPLLVEMGALLDLFVGVFIIGIIVNHINRAFSSMDTRKLAAFPE